jgi:hypothetical protein
MAARPGGDNPISNWPDSLMVAALPIKERRRHERFQPPQ